MLVAKNIGKIEKWEGSLGPGYTILLSNGDWKFWGYTKEEKRIVLVWDSKMMNLKYKKVF